MLAGGLARAFQLVARQGYSCSFSTKAADVAPKVLAKARKLSLAVGTAAGAFGSLVGVGGGVLIAPVIVNTCPSIPQRIISGTSLAAVATTGATAGYVYWSSGNVDPTSALILGAGAVLTAPLGARAANTLNCHTLRKALGYWLYLVAPLVPLKTLVKASSAAAESPITISNSDADSTGQQQQHSEAVGQSRSPAATTSAAVAPPFVQEAKVTSILRSRASNHAEQSGSSGSSSASMLLNRSLGLADAGIAATGCLAGFASGLLGIGGGTVVTPLLAVFTGMPQTQVLGTSLTAMVVPSLAGLAQHWRLGNVDWRMAAALALGTSAGSYAGSKCAIQAPPGVLEAAFAVGMLFLGRKTMTSAAAAARKSATSQLK